MPNGILEVKQIKQLSADGGGTVVDVENKTITATSASLDGAVTINESGVDVDFRVESDTNENALFVQGSDGYVGIAKASPRRNLDINGAVVLKNENPTTGGNDAILSVSTDNDSNGATISRNLQISSNWIGLLFAYEIGENKSCLLFIHKKDESGTNPQVTTLASNGLSFSASNAGGTIALTGQTVDENVRMKMLHIGDIA